MRVIYVDELLLENFVIDYILLIVSSRITGTPAKRWRIALAAGIGGAYAAVVVLSGVSILTGVLVKLAVGVIMVLISFGLKIRSVKLCLTFFALSASFAGAVMAVLIFSGGIAFGQVTFGALVVSFAVFYGIFYLVFRQIGRHQVSGHISHMVIGEGGRRVKLEALVDTGNGLYDPVSGRAVTICSLDAVSGLFDRETLKAIKEIEDPAKAMEILGKRCPGAGFCLIPYRALGVNDGLLLAFRPDLMERDGVAVKNGMVAIARDGISMGDGYSALTNAA